MSTRYNDNHSATIALIGIAAVVGAVTSIYLLNKYQKEVSGVLSRSKKTGVNIDDRLNNIEESLSALKNRISK